MQQREHKKIGKLKRDFKENLNSVYIELSIQWGLIFILAILWDRIATILYLHHSNGFSWMQGIVAVISLFQSIRFAIRVRK